MPLVPDEDAAVPPPLTAALLLLAIPMLDALGLEHPTATAVLAATGASRSHAYELRGRLEAALRTVVRPVGRPARPAPVPVDTSALGQTALLFAYDHPGAVGGTGARRRYSDDFRRFILELAATHRQSPGQSRGLAHGPEDLLGSRVAEGSSRSPITYYAIV